MGNEQSLDIPKHFTVQEMIDAIQKFKFRKPYLVPPQEFLAEHYEIIHPYEDLINYYKGTGYKMINTYYKTGAIAEVDYPDIDIRELQAVQKILGLKNEPSKPDFGKYFAQAMEKLYDEIKPIDRDRIVFRGVNKATVAQNLFTGDCVKSRLFKGIHRYCKPEEIVPIKYFEDFTTGQNPEDYVYETLGFSSTTAKYFLAEAFASDLGYEPFDTLFAFRVPAGTKGIFPVMKNATTYSGPPYLYSDAEFEMILFPKHNTFVIEKEIQVTYTVPDGDTEETVTILCGTICNDLNIYRPKDMPKLRKKMRRYYK